MKLNCEICGRVTTHLNQWEPEKINHTICVECSEKDVYGYIKYKVNIHNQLHLEEYEVKLLLAHLKLSKEMLEYMNELTEKLYQLGFSSKGE